MSVKALKRQLAAAIAMVLVATIALSSSTFAWFVGQNYVRADGLTVKAQAEKGILISHHHDTISSDVWASTAQGMFTSAIALLPTSTTSGTKWFHASAKTLTASTASSGSMVELTKLGLVAASGAQTAGVSGAIGTDSDNGKQYYILDQFDIYATADGASNLKLDSVEVSNASSSSSIDPSLRLLFVCGDKRYIVAPVSGASKSYTVGAITSNSGTITTAGTATTAYDVAGMATNYLVDGTISTDKASPVQVQVYVYFEGEDSNHFSNNLTSTNLHDLAITLQFSATVS